MKQYLQTFSDAVKDVFMEIGFQNIDLENGNHKDAHSEIVANIGLTGDLQGFLLLQADLRSAKSFIDKMLTNMSMEVSQDEGFSQFHREALGEILNQISGRSAMKLSEIEIDCDITPPTIVTGQNIYYDISSLDATNFQHVKGSYGSFGLFVGLKKPANRH